jgi:hypothetical protein
MIRIQATSAVLLIALLAFWLPAVGATNAECVPPGVTYLGQGPGSFAPLLGDVGVFVGSTPPMFAGTADLHNDAPVWSLRLGNIDPLEVRVLPPGYHLLIGEYPEAYRVRMWVFGHMAGSVRFYEALSGEDLAVVPPGDTAFVEFTTLSDGWVAVSPTETTYILQPPCAEPVPTTTGAGTIPPPEFPQIELESEPPEVTWNLWLPVVTGNAAGTK